jgi:hypothetical protein
MIDLIVTLKIRTHTIVLCVTFSYIHGVGNYAECHYAECHYAECHYAECHYPECLGGIKPSKIRRFFSFLFVCLVFVFVYGNCFIHEQWLLLEISLVEINRLHVATKY